MKNKKVSYLGNSILNYFKSYKFYFVPLGCLFFFIIIGLSISIPLISNQIKSFFDFLVSKLNEAASNTDLNNIYNSLSTEILKLDWSNAMDALNKLLTKEYLENLFNNAFSSTFSSYNSALDEIKTNLSSTIGNILNLIFLFIAIVLFGIYVSSFITKLFIRSITVSRKLRKVILGAFLRSTIETAFLVLVIYLLNISKDNFKLSAGIALVLYIVLNTFIDLLFAYFYQNGGKVKLKEVITIKSLLLNILSTIIIYAIALGVGVGLVFGINVIAGVILALPILQIAGIVNSINAESYVNHILKTKEEIIENKEELVS